MTITVLRTKNGHEIFEQAVESGYLEKAELKLEEPALNLLRKLCKQKRERITPLVKPRPHG